MIALNEPQHPSTQRLLLFGGWVILSSLVFVHPLAALVRVSLSDANASHLVLIPFITAWLLYIERHRIFLSASYDRTRGSAVLSIAICIALVTRFAVAASQPDVQLSGYVLSLMLFWAAGFAFVFGRAAWKAGSFPLLFLLLMVPWPSFLLDRVVYVLQAGSAWITEILFNWASVPALREGFVFYLPRVTIEVAKECSGIRSSIAILILALLVVHFWLKRLWTKSLFLAAGLFTMILKNGIRIATLTVLANYVDPSFLQGSLHHEGGVVFFLIGLLLLVPVLHLLRRAEGSLTKKKTHVLGKQSASEIASA
jgi:exosortase